MRLEAAIGKRQDGVRSACAREFIDARVMTGERIEDPRFARDALVPDDEAGATPDLIERQRQRIDLLAREVLADAARVIAEQVRDVIVEWADALLEAAEGVMDCRLHAARNERADRGRFARRMVGNLSGFGARYGRRSSSDTQLFRRLAGSYRSALICSRATFISAG